MTSISAVSSVTERLGNLLLDELAPARCREGLREGIVRLRIDLEVLLQELVADEDGTNNISGEVKRQVTQLAYDIEDAVESYALRQDVASRGKSGGVYRCLSKYCSTETSLHSLAKRIDVLKHFMHAEREAAAQAGTGDRSSSAGSTLSIVEPLEQYGTQVLVGMGKNEEKLKSLLLGGESKLSVIALCGMGGVGKTTLVNFLYNDDSVVQHFDNRAWACVSPTFQAKGVLGAILFSLASSTRRSKDEIAGMETMELMQQLYKTQKGRRYLVVLDDVWDTEAWDTLRFAFPDDGTGSRIVITTRSMDLASRVATSVLKMQPLNEEEGWEIFKLKSGLVLDYPGMQVNPEIEEIGRQIVRYCSGIPLAIAVIGGSLRGKNLDEWHVMLHRLQEYQKEESPVIASLNLSYNNLPFHLKQCFLYLGHFPEDVPIPVAKLYLLWMAEGLIPVRAHNNETQMEVAENYFNDLVARSLVLVEKEVSASPSSRSCRVHDLIRDFCALKGKQEEFFEVIDFVDHGNKLSSLSRRLAIYLRNSPMFQNTNDYRYNIHDAKHIRSIIFFGTDLPKSTWPLEVSGLEEFQGIRVLDFDGVDFQVRKLPRGIEKLIYLRHLSFQKCFLQGFPSSFSNFPFLETLDLRVKVSCIMTIPNVLWKLSSLRHLYFPLAFQGDTRDKLKLDTLKKLEILENFHASICDAADLLQLENLQILTVTVDGNNMDAKNTINCMNTNRFLRHSSLVVNKFDSYSEERLLIVAALLQCNSLRALEIEGYVGLLTLSERIFGSNFTSMVFNGSEFSEDPMPILGKLPNLRSLVLCNDAFVGTKMVCSESDFPQLISFKLATLQSLEKWEVEGCTVMPSLTILTIEDCYKLESLPDGLADMLLQKLMIGSMPKEFQDKVNKMIEEHSNFGNDELQVTFYDC